MACTFPALVSVGQDDSLQPLIALDASLSPLLPTACRRRGWRGVAVAWRPEAGQTAGYNLKKIYLQYLLAFERKLQEGCPHSALSTPPGGRGGRGMSGPGLGWGSAVHCWFAAWQSAALLPTWQPLCLVQPFGLGLLHFQQHRGFAGCCRGEEGKPAAQRFAWRRRRSSRGSREQQEG